MPSVGQRPAVFRATKHRYRPARTLSISPFM